MFPLSCFWKSRQTNGHNLRFVTPNKKRKLHRYQQKIAALILAHIKVSVPQNPAFVVACKNEGFRNQVCQGEGNNLIFRVPTYLPSK
jgi:hypothetical protein